MPIWVCGSLPIQISELRVGPAVRTGDHAFGQPPQRITAPDDPGPLACHVAAADVDHVRRGVPVQPDLQQPVWGGWPGLLAALTLRRLSFLVGDPSAGAVEVGLLDAFEEAEQVETGRDRVVHVFDITRGCPGPLTLPPVNPERFHLTLTSTGRPVMQGWWGSGTVARSQFTTWIGSWGGLPGARVVLVDEETGETLTTWPDEA